MNRRFFCAALALALIAAPVYASGPEDNSPQAAQSDSKPVLSLKANMGGRNMELDVEQTKDGVAVKGTMDDKSVTATGTRQEDGTVRVEVQKDKDTMLEMTINPKAMQGMGTETK